MDYHEIELIWEAYKNLLSERAVDIVEDDSYLVSKNIIWMHDDHDSEINLLKLYTDGKMFLDITEIEFIVNGTL